MDRGTQDFTLKQIWIPSSDNHLRQIQDVSIYIDCSEEDSGMVRPGHVLRWSFSTERTILSEGWACQDQCYKCWQSDQWMDPLPWTFPAWTCWPSAVRSELRKNKTETHTDRQQVHSQVQLETIFLSDNNYTLQINQSFNVREEVKCPEYWYLVPQGNIFFNLISWPSCPWGP